MPTRQFAVQVSHILSSIRRQYKRRYFATSRLGHGRIEQCMHTHKLPPAIDHRSYFQAMASHAYSIADSKTFLVIFSPVKRCFSLVHKALSSPFSTVFLFSVATIFQFVSRGCGYEWVDLPIACEIGRMVLTCIMEYTSAV